MIPDNVTLIVKAPNQQIEDQNIECASSWTVKQLKGHLTEVYPSKPSTDEQKIIYSGQLLDDSSVLKDVLRIYDTSTDRIAHTMHLVCTPKARTARPLPRDQPRPSPPETAAGGLRQRVTQTAEQPAPETATRPEIRQNDQNHTMEMQNYLSSFVNNYSRVPPYPNYPNYNFGEDYYSANHMMMIQQAYIQYMQQYANMRQAASEPEVREANAPPEEAAEVRAPPEEAAAPRDWLDHVYTSSRLAILFFLVFLYGSPGRLLLVLLLASVAYLHHIGFFRDVNVPQNGEAVSNSTQETRTNRNSLITTIWMIASSFFTSLIPETN